MSISKAVIVTGSSRGIGAAVAERLAADGFGVTINYSGSERSARKLVAKIILGDGQAIAVKADVVDPASDGAAVTFTVIDRVRGEFLHRIGYADLLHPFERT